MLSPYPFYRSFSFSHAQTTSENTEKQRIHFVLQVNGRHFQGAQKLNQTNIPPTIQGSLEKALFEFSNTIVPVVLGSRIDANVSATWLTAHCDIDLKYPLEIIEKALNSILGSNYNSNLKIRFSTRTTSKFHARRDATERVYKYSILNIPNQSPWSIPTTNKASSHWIFPSKDPLDIDLMRNMAEKCVGSYIDFSSFRGGKCGASSPIRKIQSINISHSLYDIDSFYVEKASKQVPFSTNDSPTYAGDSSWPQPHLTTFFGSNIGENSTTPWKPQEIEIVLSARSWLYRQVRNIVGYLIQNQDSGVEGISKVLNLKNNTLLPPAAPAHALSLIFTGYDSPNWAQDFELYQKVIAMETINKPLSDS